jgi:hypothetical protein
VPLTSARLARSRTLTGFALLAVLAAGCSSSGSEESATPEDEAPASSASASSSTPPEDEAVDEVDEVVGEVDPELAAAQDEFRSLAAGLEPIELSKLRPPQAPTGFDASDVAALTTMLSSVMNRSFDPTMATMSPDEALSYVLFDVDATTQANFRTFGQALEVPGSEWTQIALTRTATTPGPVTFLKARWGVQTETSETGRPYIYLVLTVLGMQEVPDAAGSLQPVLTHRTVGLSGYDPATDDSDYWEVLNITSGHTGYESCPLTTQGLLTPETQAKTLGTDYLSAKKQLKGPVGYQPFLHEDDVKAARAALTKTLKKCA